MLFAVVRIHVGKYNPAILPVSLFRAIIAVGGRADYCLGVMADGMAPCQVQVRLQYIHRGSHTQVPSVVLDGRDTRGQQDGNNGHGDQQFECSKAMLFAH